MKKEKNGISCVFPAYNEETNIERAIREAIKVFIDLNVDYEIIVVDDGSQDKTSEITLSLAQKNKNIRLIKHRVNRGYADALKTGFKSAVKTFIFYTDADNQFDLKDIAKALPLIKDVDMVIGYRLERADNFVRKLLGLEVKDIDCAFKLFRREVFDKIEIETKAWMVDTEILAKAKKQNMIIKEIGVKHLPRQHGKVTVKPGDIARSFKGLIGLKRIIK
jgi:glycosyltransferase involved in cell wall biosynthesis